MKMIVKITPVGGYVVGDGKCPFDPDEFLVAFGTRVIEAKRRGLEELEISDEEINAYLDEQKQLFVEQINAGEVREIEYKSAKDARRQIDAVIG
jgi:hypothetical protein